MDGSVVLLQRIFKFVAMNRHFKFHLPFFVFKFPLNPKPICPDVLIGLGPGMREASADGLHDTRLCLETEDVLIVRK
jgi:hypothetical protein